MPLFKLQDIVRNVQKQWLQMLCLCPFCLNVHLQTRLLSWMLGLYMDNGHDRLKPPGWREFTRPERHSYFYHSRLFLYWRFLNLSHYNLQKPKSSLLPPLPCLQKITHHHTVSFVPVHLQSLSPAAHFLCQAPGQRAVTPPACRLQNAGIIFLLLL